MSSRCLHNIVNFRPLAAEIGLPVWGTPANFNGFRVLAALLHGSQVVGVEQRASPMFGRATITLGIGPRSSSLRFTTLITLNLSPTCFTNHSRRRLFSRLELNCLHGPLLGPDVLS